MIELPRLDVNKENREVCDLFLEMYEFHKKRMEHCANQYWNAIYQNDDRLLEEFDKKQDRENIILKSRSDNL